MNGATSGAPRGARTPFLLRIEKGEPDLPEIGALTAVLLRRLTAAPATHGPARAAARWRRPERSRDFRGPRSWRESPS